MRRKGYELKHGYAVLAIPDSGLFVKDGRIVSGHETDLKFSAELMLFSRETRRRHTTPTNRKPTGKTETLTAGHTWSFSGNPGVGHGEPGSKPQPKRILNPQPWSVRRGSLGGLRQWQRARKTIIALGITRLDYSKQGDLRKQLTLETRKNNFPAKESSRHRVSNWVGNGFRNSLDGHRRRLLRIAFARIRRKPQHRRPSDRQHAEVFTAEKIQELTAKAQQYYESKQDASVVRAAAQTA